MHKQIIFEKKEGKDRIQVADMFMSGELVRICLYNGYMQSGMYLDEEMKNELLFPYMRCFSYAFTLKKEIRSVLLIGGGTFSYPRYFLDHYRKAHLTVLEKNQDMIDLSRSYFGMDDLDIEEKANLTVICDDAFGWLEKTDLKFDWIINDAFYGNEMIGRNENSLELVVSHLNVNGIYMENMVSPMRGPFAKALHKEEELLNELFVNVEKMQCDDSMHVLARQNILITCQGRRDNNG